jgi:hypothetical protein
MPGRFDTTCASGTYASGNNAIRGQQIQPHMKSILDPSFRYTASFNTDLQKTFARIRHDHRQEAERAVQATADALASVSSIVRKAGRGR